MFTIPQTVFTILEAVFIVLGAYFVLFWIGLVVWTFQDIRHRSHDWLVQILSVLLVLVFHVAGLVVYLILRPQETLAEVYNRNLEAEALLQSMEETLACPRCHRRVKEEFIACPYCGETLKQTCLACGRLLALNWSLCPYCTTPVDGRQKVETPSTVDNLQPVASFTEAVDEEKAVNLPADRSESWEGTTPSSPSAQPSLEVR